MRRRSRVFHALARALPALALAFCPAPAGADVTINETMKFDGIGDRGWGASEGTSVMIVSSDKARQESTTKMTGKFLGRFGGKDGFKSATITRLDRKSLISIDYQDESYYEMTFAQMKQNMDAALGAMSEALQQQPQPDAGKPSEKEARPITCGPVKLEAKRTGEKQTLGGFPAERALITGTQSCENPEAKQSCSMLYTVDMWHTPATSALGEVLAFYSKMAEAMDFDFSQLEALRSAGRALMLQGTEGLQQVMSEMRKVEGYAVKTRITIEQGGDCGGGAGGPEGGGSPEGMKGLGDLFKGFGKKKKSGGGEEGAAKKAEPSGTPGMTKIFGTTTEVTSITTTAAPSGSFDPPAGFKKKEPPEMPKPAKS